VVASLTFATPLAGLLALLVLFPLAALALGLRRVAHARAVLRLAAPGRRSGWYRTAAVAAVPLLLAIAATQPGLRRHSTVSVRADAAVFVVIDTSESMGAASGPHASSRLAQAKRVALGVGASLDGIPLGVATFTDRVLPNLFPTADGAVFSSTIEGVGVDSPPPRETSRVATGFSALAALGTQGFFTRAQKHRAILLITDGESRTFDAAALARSLASSPGAHLVIVRVGGGGDRLYAADGTASSVYRADPAGARQAVSQLASATNGRAFTAGSSGVVGALRDAVGSGSRVSVRARPETDSLTQYVVLLALLPLLVILAGAGGRSFPRRARPSSAEPSARRSSPVPSDPVRS
jgi:hypothetical protein